MLAKKIIITTFISLFACPLLMGMEIGHSRYWPEELNGSLLILMHVNDVNKLVKKGNEENLGLPQEVVKAGIIPKICNIYISKLRKSGHSGQRGFICCSDCFEQKLPYLNLQLEKIYSGGKPVTIPDVMLLSDNGSRVFFNFSN